MSRVYRNEKPVVDVNQWMCNPNGSIFIKYVPNHIMKSDLRSMFDFLGFISRIDIVNIAEGGSGRRAFIHFSSWKESEDSFDLRNQIANRYPVHTQVFMNSFEYSITLNSRPIPSTELNPQQLSDWSQRLNDELVDFKKETATQIAVLLAANAKLASMVETVTTESALLRTEIADIRVENNELKFEVSLLNDRIEYMEQEHQEYEDYKTRFILENQSEMDEIEYDIEMQEVLKSLPPIADLDIIDEIDQAIQQQEVFPGISVADIEMMEEKRQTKSNFGIEILAETGHRIAR